jgi:hypothetical protein
MQTGENIRVGISGIEQEVVTLSDVVKKRKRGMLPRCRGLWFHLII